MGVTAWNKGLNGIAYIKAKLVPFSDLEWPFSVAQGAEEAPEWP